MTAVPQPQTNISRRTLDIEDYIDIARRHISWIIGPLYAGIVISTMVAFFLPNVYISRAVLRVTSSAIPENLVPAVFNQQMTDRISQIWQEVISRGQLSELIQRPTLNLYPTQRNHKPLEDVIEDMKAKDIRLDITSLNQSANGGKPNSTFQVSFKYPERFKAQAVVSALVTKLTNANQEAQRTNVNVTRDLMSDELKQAKDDLEKVDQELTSFKMANSGRLPEQLQLNVSAMTALQTRMTSINDALQRIAEQKLMDEDRLTSAKAMVGQMETALNQTGQEEVGGATHEERRQNQDLLDLDREISLMEAKLAVDQQNYTEKHPDVIDDKTKLKILRQRRDQLMKEDTAANAAASAAAADASKKKPAPPKKGVSLQNQQALAQSKAAISQTEAQLTALEMDRNDKVKEQAKINEQLAAFQARIEASPINEQKYASLMQQRRQAEEHYDTLMKKSQLAEQGVAVTERKAGETLEMLDTASLPETPAEPNRWQIVAIGSFAGLLVGLMMAGAKEMKDTSLKNLKDVRAYTNLPVLSSIPLLENALLVRRKRRLAYVAWAVAVIIGLVGTAIAVYYYQYNNK
jgi:succinoglycan biosynthesis transport protein ExoP